MKKCEYEEIITGTGCEAMADENGNPIPIPVEVPIGLYCHKNQEYSPDCSKCELGGAE